MFYSLYHLHLIGHYGNNHFLNEENDNCEYLSSFCANKVIHVKVINTNTECSKENVYG